MSKIRFAKKAYNSLDRESQDQMTPVKCTCVKDDENLKWEPDPKCGLCDGEGIVFEHEISQEDWDKIAGNLKRQGVPLK